MDDQPPGSRPARSTTRKTTSAPAKKSAAKKSAAKRPAKKSAAKKSAAKKSAARKSAGKKSAAKRTAASRSAAAGAARPSAAARRRGFPGLIYAVASPPSVGGTSLFAGGALATAETVDAFLSDDTVVLQAAEALAEAGFEVLQASNLMINIAGTMETFENAFGAHLFTEERRVIKAGGIEDDATYIDNADTGQPGLIDTAGTAFAELLEGVALEEPYYANAASPLPPMVDYWHLDVANDVSVALNAERPHRNGITGKDVRVAMVDTGFQEHPYFTEHGYRVEPTVLAPGAANATVDNSGHGTGESANIFAAAPDVTLLPVKLVNASGAFVNTTGAVNAAVALAPDIITNSWGSSIQNGPLSAANQALAAAIAGAVASGIVVVFSAGNGHWGFPGQHPDVVSAGGVHRRQSGVLEASSYSSGFMSNIYPGRRVPDVSGLVGMSPGARYIMLPIPEGCDIDQGGAGGSWPNGDETATNDGWAAFSGTSAAAPQVAGVCALMLQACRRLTPARVRSILMSTARDVTIGTNALGNTATVGPDTATGNGLVNAHRAVLLAKLRCITGPVVPLRPVVPVLPLRPVLPVGPVVPTLPLRPVLPVGPVVPTRPVLPLRPVVPVIPFRPPVIPFRPPILAGEEEPEAAAGHPPAAAGGEPLTEEEVAELERYIIESDEPPEL